MSFARLTKTMSVVINSANPDDVFVSIPPLPFSSIFLKFTTGNPGLKFVLGDLSTVFDVDEALATDEFLGEAMPIIRSQTHLIIGSNDTSQNRGASFVFGTSGA